MKKLLSFMFLLCFLSVCFMLCGFTFFKKEAKPEKTNSVENSVIKEKLWCTTFQLVWNDFMDNINKGKPVEFVNGNPPIADELNKRLYTESILSSDSYYKKYGLISKSLRKTIENGIKKQFNEKSDILNLIDWNAENSYLFYVMLIKDFNFEVAFDELKSSTFNGSEEKVKYFGIDKKSNKRLKGNVDVLFYNSADDYAVKLLTKENEEVILLRSEKNDSFENLYTYIEENTKFDEFREKDELKIPNINVDELIKYDELCNKPIKDSNYVISQALQTIKFKMDNKGGKLKSEAAIIAVKTALFPPIDNSPRFFMFDKKFVLFLKEAEKDKPYYAMKVDDTSFLVKD